MAEDILFMEEALREALKALSKDEVPVGCVVVNKAGEIVGRGHNSPLSAIDPTAHAEMIAIREAALRSGNYRLPGHTLYSTIEPCPMCAGAIIHARIPTVVFGARDEKGGGMVSIYGIGTDGKLNHTVELKGGVLEEKCRTLLQDFFKARRGK